MAAVQSVQERQFATSTTYANIFDQPGPQIRLSGTQAALIELRKTVAIDHLVVQSDKPSHPGEAVERSLDLLRLKNAFPSNKELLQFAAQPSELQLASGITPKSWIVTHTVQNTVRPPFSFRDLNVDFLLAFLRVAQTYHGQNRTYQLLILTRMNRDQYHIDLLPSVPGATGTHSILLYRSFGHAADGSMVEHWRGSTLRPQAQPPQPEVVAPSKLPSALVERIKRLRKRQLAMSCQGSGPVSQNRILKNSTSMPRSAPLTDVKYQSVYTPPWATLEAPILAPDDHHFGTEGHKSLEMKIDDEARQTRSLRAKTRTPIPILAIDGDEDEDNENEDVSTDQIETDNEEDDFKGDLDADDDDSDFEEDGDLDID